MYLNNCKWLRNPVHWGVVDHENARLLIFLSREHFILAQAQSTQYLHATLHYILSTDIFGDDQIDTFSPVVDKDM